MLYKYLKCLLVFKYVHAPMALLWHSAIFPLKAHSQQDLSDFLHGHILCIPSFEPQGRRFTNFHSYYERHAEKNSLSLEPCQTLARGALECCHTDSGMMHFLNSLSQTSESSAVLSLSQFVCGWGEGGVCVL